MANNSPVRKRSNNRLLLLALLQAVFIVAKLTGGMHLHWGWVLLPGIIYIILVLGVIFLAWLAVNWEEQEMLNKKR